MTSPSDWDLIAAAQAGDMAAFAELVARYQVPVVHFCRRMTGSLDDAEDIAQDSFVRIYRSLDRLTPKAKFTTALFGIARNLTLNFLRDTKRRGRGRTESLTREHGEENLIADASLQPDRAAGLSEIESQIEQALQKLTPEHREILVLREIQGLDYDAIAEVLRCRKGTVKSRLARAREHMRDCLVEAGVEWL